MNILIVKDIHQEEVRINLHHLIKYTDKGTWCELFLRGSEILNIETTSKKLDKVLAKCGFHIVDIGQYDLE